MPFQKLKSELATALTETLAHPEFTSETLFNELGTPPNLALGHLALPCFRMAKAFKKNPQAVAVELVTKMKGPRWDVTAAGPYANFRFSPQELFQSTFKAILAEGDRYGSDTDGNQRPILIEFCSPNIAKQLGFHHIRTTLIGSTLANIYDYLGYKTERMNFVGDWGSQFARLLAAFEQWGDKSQLSMKDIPKAMAHLSEIYVRFHKDLEQNPERLEKANASLKKLEAGDAQVIALWKSISEISIAAMEKTLSRLHVRFDHVDGESQYVPQIAPMLDEVKEKAGARLSEGAWIVEVEGYTTPALIQKRDGTTLYLTRDIAAAADRAKRFSFEKMLYVVSEQQRLHFQLLFGVLKKMGFAWADKCEHLSFGTVLFGSEKMSTREGRIILLEDILNEAKSLALVECTAKNPDLANKEEVAEMVGVGAVVFGELSCHRQRDIEFNFKEILAFEGETGPYVQYAAVRCQSLMEKAREAGMLSDTVPSTEDYPFAAEEEALILELSKFRSALLSSVRDNEPYHLTHYLIDVAKAYNRFYYRFPVLQASEAKPRDVRLWLCRGTRQVLVNGLRLLGISCPKEM